MAKRRTPRPLPEFESEAEEREFWETHDTTSYVDWSQAKRAVFPNLKPSTETISLRLPAGLLAEIKSLANQRDVPYQSLLKMYLAERVARERLTRPGTMPSKALRAMSRARRRSGSAKAARTARG